MWLKGDKTWPILSYAPTEKPQVLLDVVEYMQGARVKQIKGIDYSPKGNLEFVWRGNGVLRLLKSHWRIEHICESAQWMILSFEKTLFTPAGHDIIVKEGVDWRGQSKLMLAKFKGLFPSTAIYPLYGEVI